MPSTNDCWSGQPLVARFPEGFPWGVATAAHQVEDNNIGSDAWLMEHLPGTVYREPSGDAPDFYYRYADDIAVIAALGLNVFRFSVEWARIEPDNGERHPLRFDRPRQRIRVLGQSRELACEVVLQVGRDGLGDLLCGQRGERLDPDDIARQQHTRYLRRHELGAHNPATRRIVDPGRDLGDHDLTHERPDKSDL